MLVPWCLSKTNAEMMSTTTMMMLMSVAGVTRKNTSGDNLQQGASDVTYTWVSMTVCCPGGWDASSPVASTTTATHQAVSGTNVSRRESFRIVLLFLLLLGPPGRPQDPGLGSTTSLVPSSISVTITRQDEGVYARSGVCVRAITPLPCGQISPFPVPRRSRWVDWPP